MAVQTGDLTFLGSVGHGSDLALTWTYGVASLRLEERLFLYAAGEGSDGITILELLPGGELIPLGAVFDGPETALDDVNHLAIASVGTDTFLYANSQVESGVTVFRIGADGSLSQVQSIYDTDETATGGAVGEMEVTTVNGQTYLLATGETDAGLTAFRIDADGHLVPTSSVFEDQFGLSAALAGARGVTSAAVGDTQFAVVAGFQDDGLAVFEIDAQGGLTHTWSVFDSISMHYELNGAIDVASAEILGMTYIFAAGVYDDGISAFVLSQDGRLSHSGSVSDGVTASALNGVEALEVFSVSGETFLAASAYQESAVSVFHIGPTGSLTEVETVRDTTEAKIGGSAGLSVEVVEGRVLIFAGGYSDSGVSAVELGGGPDMLLGTVDADLTFGFAGDDTIVGSAGSDTIAGGAGHDSLSYAGSPEPVSVDLTVGAGLGGHAEDDVIREIEMLDGSDHDDTLIGSDLPEMLTGGGGGDLIFADGSLPGPTSAELAALLAPAPDPLYDFW